MGEATADARVNMVVDITTTGRKSGEPRRIEIWAQSFDGRLFITGSPGKRSWYANLVATPNFVYHPKEDGDLDVPAVARPITNEEERRATYTRLKEVSEWWEQNLVDVDGWVQESPLVEVTLT